MNGQLRNALLIAVDDLNDWIGCLGHSAAVTPHLDRLAARGVLCRSAQTPYPLCGPARTAMITGLLPHRSGVYDNKTWWRPALPDVVTLPELFMAAGHRVEGSGKVLHHTAGHNPPALWHAFQDPIFDDPWARSGLWATLFPGIPPTPTPAWIPLHGQAPLPDPEGDWGVLPHCSEAEYGDVQSMDRAVAFLQGIGSRPFFYAAGQFAPHLPYYVPQRYFDLYDPATLPLPDPEVCRTPAGSHALPADDAAYWQAISERGLQRDMVHAYLARVSFADAQIGRVLDALDASGHGEDTAIVLFSDHGFHFGEKGRVRKRTLWQRATGVPFIVVAPGLLPAGTVYDPPVSTVDTYATLCACCGLEPPPGLDSRSLLPRLLEPDRHPAEPVLVNLGPGNFAVVDERWRLIRYADGNRFLYDRRNDPQEQHDLAGQPGSAAVITALERCLPQRCAEPARTGRHDLVFDVSSYTWSPAPAR